jgi:hypothetical protein
LGVASLITTSNFAFYPTPANSIIGRVTNTTTLLHEDHDTRYIGTAPYPMPVIFLLKSFSLELAFALNVAMKDG